jgi:hemoglobin
MARTIFERYGGFAQISQAVMAFYEKVLSSPITSPYFEHTDMRRLIDLPTRFIATVMGGPASYSNDRIERVHADRGVTGAAFMEVVELLNETLGDFDFAEEDIQHVVDEMMSRKNYVVSR